MSGIPDLELNVLQRMLLTVTGINHDIDSEAGILAMRQHLGRLLMNPGIDLDAMLVLVAEHFKEDAAPLSAFQFTGSKLRLVQRPPGATDSLLEADLPSTRGSENKADGVALVRLTSMSEFAEEGAKLQHALAYYFDKFSREGTQVYSLRRSGEPILTLSVREGSAFHVVGLHNRPPTSAELAQLSGLLAAQGIELNYDPKSLH